jgi:PIN domain nuclease of toxin-antitoxin system
VTSKHIVDTHTLLWFPEENPRLGSSAKAILEEPSSALFLPIIALVEACWMVEPGDSTIPSVEDLLAAVDADPRLEIIPWNRDLLDRSVGLTAIDEMHDRQIVASALVLPGSGVAAARLTRDSVIQSSGLGALIW